MLTNFLHALHAVECVLRLAFVKGNLVRNIVIYFACMKIKWAGNYAEECVCARVFVHVFLFVCVYCSKKLPMGGGGL